jgi:hypothetical protein
VHRGHDRRDREGRHDDEGDASGVADVAGGSSAMRRELRTRIGTRWAHQGAQREPTKDALLQAAYRRVIDRVTERVTALLPAASARDFVRALLLELLPLDAEREAELRVGLAFTARSVVSPPLAELYAEGHRALVEALEGALRLAVALGGGAARHRRQARGRHGRGARGRARLAPALRAGRAHGAGGRWRPRRPSRPAHAKRDAAGR